MRLIDADELAKKWTIASPEPYNTDAVEVLDSIREAPPVDAVVITRCKYCRRRGSIFCPAMHETIGNGLVDCAVDNGYCWCGKPKET